MHFPDSARPELFDDAALERIIAATDAPLRNGNRDDLRQNLIAAWQGYVLLDSLTKGNATKGIERLKRIRKWVAKGVALLQDDADDIGHIQELWRTHGNASDLLPQLRWLIKLLDGMNLGRAQYQGSPKENLVGVVLPSIFKCFFDEKLRVSYSDYTGESGGPYISFAKEVCLTLGLGDVPANTIKSAITSYGGK